MGDVKEDQPQFGDPEPGRGVLTPTLLGREARVPGGAAQLVRVDTEWPVGDTATLRADRFQDVAIPGRQIRPGAVDDPPGEGEPFGVNHHALVLSLGSGIGTGPYP